MLNWAPKALLGTAVVVSLTIAACSLESRNAAAAGRAVKAEKDRKQAPDFTLKDSNGSSVKLSDYKGRVVLLNFWATWCGPCKIEIPWFMEFEQSFKDKGFAVLGVSMDDDGWDAVKPYIENRRVNYRVLLGDESVGDLYGGIESLPTTFLVDRDGRIASIHVGLVSKRDYENEIHHLLENKPNVASTAGQ